MLCQLHLQTTFMCPGTPGEDVQNKRRTVDYLYLESFFQVPLLYRGKLIINNDYTVIDSVFQSYQLFQFTFASIVRFLRY